MIIENISPVVDSGRYAAKRIVGDDVVVGADIFKDGHDRLGARVVFRGPGDRRWGHAAMTYDFPADRWSAAFRVDRVGRWEIAVEAWPDEYETWCHDVAAKAGAGQDVSVELLDGAAQLQAASRRARGADRRVLQRRAAVLADEALSPEDRCRDAQAEDTRALMAAYFDAKLVTKSETFPLVVDRERARFAAWYEFFPRSQVGPNGDHGTFADAERLLPRVAELGFDVVYLPPIHPIGRTHRKGKNNAVVAAPDDVGSPWAIGGPAGGHTAVEPALGTLEDFDRFVATAGALGLEVALDYALQCSPDHPWVHEHPDWFFHRADGSIQYAENPPKKYQDIFPIHFWCADRAGLWAACKEIVDFWIGHGVRTFRVDNPHTKPLAFWEWMIDAVKAENPDVIFLAEAFTRPKRMQALAKLGFTQSYSYFTWRNDSGELSGYLTELTRPPMVDVYRPNFFANTPDILHEYLQAGGRAAFRVRLLLAATLSPLYGIYSGFELAENVPLRAGSEEYLDSEKYEIRPRDWAAPGNLDDDITLINRLRREHPALHLFDNISFHLSENDRILFFCKRTPNLNDVLLIAVNLDPHRAQESMVHVPLDGLGWSGAPDYQVEDLLTGVRYTWHGERNYVRLDPTERVAHVLRWLPPWEESL